APRQPREAVAFPLSIPRQCVASVVAGRLIRANVWCRREWARGHRQPSRRITFIRILMHPSGRASSRTRISVGAITLRDLQTEIARSPTRAAREMGLPKSKTETPPCALIGVTMYSHNARPDGNVTGIA